MKRWIGIVMAVLALVIYNQTGNIKLAWDHDGIGVDHYEITLVRDGTGEIFTYGTSAKTISIPKPKSGVYQANVRAVKKLTDGTQIPSEWCRSNSVCGTLKDGTSTDDGWKTRWKPTAPLIITVE